MYHKLRHCVPCAKGKKGQRQLTYHLSSLNAGNKANMLLINILGLIVKLKLVWSDFEFGSRKL